MKTRAKILMVVRIIVYVLVAVLLYVAVAWPVHSGPVNRAPAPEWQLLAGVYGGCLQYQRDWGVFPSDQRGEAEALYKLRGRYWGEFLVDPSQLGPEVDPRSDARFDDAQQRLVGFDWEYLNQPSAGPSVVLFAQKWVGKDGYRWFVGLDDIPRRCKPTWPEPTRRLVGWMYERERDEFILRLPGASGEERIPAHTRPHE